MEEEQYEKLILLGIYLPYVKDVLIKKNTNGAYDHALALLHVDLRKMKERLYKERISIRPIDNGQKLFKGFIISQKGQTIEKSFFKPHMKNVIKTLIGKYIAQQSLL
ncbi:hypothetical protein CIB95_13660 [Lottiidibacillus patelloidae]|uniref:Uncharacterized protein n=1 Tax=Lottiidibacillus patelloidae TaxID=2670334 RepID=A0A263BRE7_9BACI|nr:hypothetical protein [Lottiidibacillus patelloidae]OZM56148.1 hypothetical protein CIB95_13660 [Lottiidibacillus patelloidae]